MTIFKHAGPALCALAFGATAASADVTAQQVWDEWRQGLAMYGEDNLTVGSEDMSDGTLTVSDLTMTITDPEATVTLTLPSLVFTENGDGTVSVEMPAESPVTIAATPDSGEASDVALVLSQTGMEITVSGDPGNTTYDISADRYALEVESIVTGGETLDAEILFALNALSGSYAIATGDTLRDIDYTVNADSLDILVDVVGPADEPGQLTLSGKVEDLVAQASVAMPLEVDMEADPAAMFRDGFAVDGGYEFGALSYLFDFTDDAGDTSSTASAAGGSLSFELSNEVLAYDSGLNDLAITLQGSTLPFPVELGLAEYGVSFEMPTAATEEPRDFGLSLRLVDLALDDMIWSMADPTGQLPHDPATVVVDISGTAKLDYDLFDPEQQAEMQMAESPGELYSATLNELTIDVAGVQVSGEGSFTFDNSDLTTLEGMPRPAGSATFEVTGANALLDKLVAMGLVPPDQVMGARMMLGLFAEQVGEDQLRSVIEITDDFQIFANGQRLQ